MLGLCLFTPQMDCASSRTVWLPAAGARLRFKFCLLKKLVHTDRISLFIADIMHPVWASPDGHPGQFMVCLNTQQTECNLNYELYFADRARIFIRRIQGIE